MYDLIQKCTVMALCALLFSCSSDPSATLEDAELLESQGKITEAIVVMKSAVQASPNDPNLRFKLGSLYNRLSDGEGAEKELRKSLELGQADNINYQIELTKSYVAQERFVDTVEYVDKVIEGPSSGGAVLLAFKGFCQLALEDSEGAIKSSNKANEWDADAPEVIYLKAHLEAKKSNYEGALASLQEVIGLNPDYYQAYAFKGDLLKYLGRRDEALAAYDELLNRWPTNFYALRKRIPMLVFNGALDKALKDAQLLEGYFPSNPAGYFHVGMVYLAQGKAQQALTSARNSLSKDADFVPAKLLSARALNRLGALSQAEQQFESFLASVPFHLPARQALAEIQIKTGRPDAGFETLEPLITSGIANADVYALAGLALRRDGDDAAAAKYFAQAAEADPEDFDANVFNALSKFDTEGFDQGLDQLRGVLNEAPHVSLADEVLVEALLRAGKVAAVDEHLDRIEERFPDSHLVHRLRGESLVAQQRFSEARANLEKSMKIKPDYIAAARMLETLDVLDGKPKAALQRYEKMAADNNNNVEILLALASRQWRSGLLEQATETLVQANREAPEQLQPALELIRVNIAQNKLQNASRLAQRTLDIHPNEPQVIELAARALLLEGKKVQAANMIERLIQPGTRSPDVYIAVSNFLFEASQLKAAEDKLREGAKIFPDSPKMFVALVKHLLSKKDVNGAMKVTESLKQRKPNAAFAYVIEAEIAEKNGDYSTAVKLYDVALGKQAIAPIAVKRFSAEAKRNNLASAIEGLDKWITANPQSVIARAKLAEVLAQSGDFATAQEHYQYILTNVKEIPSGVLNSAAWTSYKTGDPNALSIAAAAYRAAPNSAYVLDTYGWLLAESNDAENGVRYLRLAANLAEDNGEIRYHLGKVLADLGDSKGAETHLTAASELLPDSEISSLARSVLRTLR